MTYKITSLDGKVLATKFWSDDEAKRFADMRGMYEIKIVDERTGEVMYDFENRNEYSGGFINVGGMTYDQVRRMGRE